MKGKLSDKKGFKKVKRKLDKLLLGVVVGGAVGSILGVTLAPKSGKETRQYIGSKGKETWQRLSDAIEEKKEQQTEEKRQRKGFWFMLHRLVFGKKK